MTEPLTHEARRYVSALRAADDLLAQHGDGYELTRARLRELSVRVLGLLEAEVTVANVARELAADEWDADTLDMIGMAVNDPKRYAAMAPLGNHGPGCDGPLNCTCPPGPMTPAEEALADSLEQEGV